jgi:hypothetical protein
MLTQRTLEPSLRDAEGACFAASRASPRLGLGTLEKAATCKYVKSKVCLQANQRCQILAIPRSKASTANTVRTLRPVEPGAPPCGSSTNESISSARAKEAVPANGLRSQKFPTAPMPAPTVPTCQSRRAVLGSTSRAYRVVGEREFPRPSRLVLLTRLRVFRRADSRGVPIPESAPSGPYTPAIEGLSAGSFARARGGRLTGQRHADPVEFQSFRRLKQTRQLSLPETDIISQRALPNSLAWRVM